MFPVVIQTFAPKLHRLVLLEHHLVGKQRRHANGFHRIRLFAHIHNGGIGDGHTVIRHVLFHILAGQNKQDAIHFCPIHRAGAGQLVIVARGVQQRDQQLVFAGMHPHRTAGFGGYHPTVVVFARIIARPQLQIAELVPGGGHLLVARRLGQREFQLQPQVFHLVPIGHIFGRLVTFGPVGVNVVADLTGCKGLFKRRKAQDLLIAVGVAVRQRRKRRQHSQQQQQTAEPGDGSSGSLVLLHVFSSFFTRNI